MGVGVGDGDRQRGFVMDTTAFTVFGCLPAVYLEWSFQWVFVCALISWSLSAPRREGGRRRGRGFGFAGAEEPPQVLDDVPQRERDGISDDFAHWPAHAAPPATGRWGASTHCHCPPLNSCGGAADLGG